MLYQNLVLAHGSLFLGFFENIHLLHYFAFNNEDNHLRK